MATSLDHISIDIEAFTALQNVLILMKQPIRIEMGLLTALLFCCVGFQMTPAI